MVRDVRCVESHDRHRQGRCSILVTFSAFIHTWNERRSVEREREKERESAGKWVKRNDRFVSRKVELAGVHVTPLVTAEPITPRSRAGEAGNPRRTNISEKATIFSHTGSTFSAAFFPRCKKQRELIGQLESIQRESMRFVVIKTIGCSFVE